jgi:hypothetical protein
MADYTQIIRLNDHKRGDKWVGIPSIGPVTINEAQPSLELVRVRMQFRKGSSVYKLDTDVSDRDAPITIVDSTTWEVTVPEVDDGFLQTKGCWEWDMEFWEDGKNAPITLFKGDIEIHEDVTI